MNGMQTPLIAHRCGRAYGPDSSRRALRAALAGGPLGGVETDVCLTRDSALVCLHDPCLAVGTTLTGWAHERSSAELLAGRLLDGAGRASAERPLLVDELFDLIPPRLTVQLDIKAHADEALARWALSAGLRGVCVEHFLLDSPIVAALRGEGLSVTTGTVNHAAIAERVLARAPDALTTDRPHELRAELARLRPLAA